MSIKQELRIGHKAVELETRAENLRTEAVKTLQQLEEDTTNGARLIQEAQKSTELEWRFFVIDDDYEQTNNTTKIHGYVFIKPTNSTDEEQLVKAPGAHLALIQHKAGGPQVIRRAMATRESDSVEQGVGYYEFSDLPTTPGEYSIRGKYVDNKATVYQGEIDPQRGGYTNFRRENQTHLVIDEKHAEPQEAHLVLEEVPTQGRIGDGGKTQEESRSEGQTSDPGTTANAMVESPEVSAVSGWIIFENRQATQEDQEATNIHIIHAQENPQVTQYLNEHAQLHTKQLSGGKIKFVFSNVPKQIELKIRATNKGVTKESNPITTQEERRRIQIIFEDTRNKTTQTDKETQSKDSLHPKDETGGQTQDEDNTSKQASGSTSSTDKKTQEAQKPTVHIRPAEGALKPVENYILQGATAKVTDHLLDNTLEFEVWTQGGSGVWHFDYDVRFSYATEDNQSHWLREGQADRIGLTFSGMQTLKGGKVPFDAQAVGLRAAETSPEASEEYEKRGGPATEITAVQQDKSSVAIYSLEQIRASASKKTLRVSFGDFAENKKSLQATYQAKGGVFGILEALENDPDNAPEHQKRVYAFTIHARVALTKKGETPDFTNPSDVATIYVYNPAIN